MKLPKVFILIVSLVVFITTLAIIIPIVATAVFNHKVNHEVQALFKNHSGIKKEVVEEEDLRGYPLGVQKWLKKSGIIGKEKTQTVRLKQRALLRLKKDNPWMPADVEQYFTVNKPGFVWKAKVKMAPLLYFTGRDRYDEGKGHMLIKVLSLWTVADAQGPEINQGTMLRYLAEMVWFPSAALSPYIVWEEINHQSAKATMTYGGITASGVFTFNEQGEVMGLVAERYGEFDGQYVMKTWSVTMKEHKSFNGVRIPSKGAVTWKLDNGDFKWYQFEILNIEYDTPRAY